MEGESTLSPALRKFQKQGAMVARLSTLQSASAAAARATTSTSRDLERKMAMRDSAQLGELSSLAVDVTEMRRELAEAATERQLILGALQALEGKLSEMVPRVEPDEG